MKLLAWDTSTKAGALAALEWDPASREGRLGLRLVSEWTLNVDANQSEQLLWGVDQLIRSIHWKLEDIDVFGVGVGPGSFTGLRIGITTARTLARALGKPLVGVSSLAALARPVALSALTQKKPVTVIATTDACKGELFALVGSAKAVVDCAVMADQDRPGLWKRGVEEVVIRPEELVRMLKKKMGKGATAQWIAPGEGRKRYQPELWGKLPARTELETPFPFADLIQGRYVGMLTWEAYQAGLARDPLLVHPRYLRASDAELKLKAGLLPAGPTRGDH